MRAGYRQPKPKSIALALVVALMTPAALVTADAAPAGAEPGFVTLDYTGGAEPFVVPPDVTSIAVDVLGAQGGHPSWGGPGARVRATVTVTPGQTLHVYAGGAGGQNAGGFNGGGGASSNGYRGGGASDIRTSPQLADRIVVAGGGGGAGRFAAGVVGSGGAGGAPSGANGDGGCLASAAGGGGATPAGGGVGGNDGGAGISGNGGVGGTASGNLDDGGGGGGGGYFGGGGGGSASCGKELHGGGGGGGGSSWVTPSASNVEYRAGARRGNGQVTISWPPAAPEPETPTPGSATFDYTGDASWFVVPPGVTAISVDAYGAQGGNESWGGPGARAQATLSVTPGQLLQVNVGGAGGFDSGGFNGGAAIWGPGGGWRGGGASDVRVSGTTLSDRLLVAGGGGGAGGDPGSLYGSGGGGGAPDGGAGAAAACATGGTGATQTTAGAGGTGYDEAGGAGALGRGGHGDYWGHQKGGGGGGGHYGGGGGGACYYKPGSGGGGGSSWSHPTLAFGPQFEASSRRGNGFVKITWPPALPQPVDPPDGTATFDYTGDAQWWVVPDGVTAIAVDARGAQGGSTNGGAGGQLNAVLAVVPGQLVHVVVGGAGGEDAGGFNGGGDSRIANSWGGGGASDLRIGGLALTDRVAVAGGGGGAGGTPTAACGLGGGGGGLAGNTGGLGCDTASVPTGGGGGTQTAGGLAGVGQSPQGEPGAFGVGGAGDYNGHRQGGGGGGGYYGGGGGGACFYCDAGAGGGGGSSYVKPELAFEASTQPGVHAGAGSITISWPVEPDVKATFGADSYGEYRNGVHIGSGNFVDSTTDVEIATAGPDLRLDRTYNSLDPRIGLFGRGWSTPYDVSSFIAPESATAVIVYPDGRRENHTKQSDGSWKAPLGYVSKLDEIVDGGWKVTHKDKSVYAFNTEGRLSSITDRYGRALTLTYDASGHLDRVTDAASGRYLDFTFTGATVSSVATNPVTVQGVTAPLIWNYGYTGDLLTKACDARDPSLTTGFCTTYTYTADRLTKITKPRGNDEVRLAYNEANKVQWSENGAGDRVTFSYGGGITQITDGRGFPTAIFYDHLFRTTRIVEVNGATTKYEYDANGFRSAVEDANNNRATMTYDARGNLLAQTNAEGETTRFEYAGDDQIAVHDGRTTDPTKNTYKTTSTYNAQGDLLTTTSPPTTEYPAGITATTTYTAGGENVGYGPMPAGLVRSQSPGKGTTWFEYDSAGNLRRRIDATGLVVTFSYDALGRRTDEARQFAGGFDFSSVTLDRIGNVLTELRPMVPDTTVTPAVNRQAKTTNTYDRNGNLETAMVADVGGSASPMPVRLTTYIYDDADRLAGTTDPENGGTARFYDANGNVILVIDAEFRVLETVYDALDRKTELRLLNFVDDPVVGTASRVLVMAQWEYDAAGRVVVERKPQPGTGGRPGQLSPSTPMSEQRTAYDRADRVLSVTLKNFDNRPGVTPATRDIPLAAYIYDDAGNRISETVGGVRTTTRDFDAANRVQSASTPVGGVTRVVEYDYDPLGKPTRTTVKPAGGAALSETRAVYNDLGLPVSQTVENGATDLVTIFTYDARGLQTSMVDARGKQTEYGYTVTGLQESIRLPQVSVEENGGASTLTRPETRFGYDAAGNRTAVRDARGNRTVTTYDRLNRQTLIAHPSYTPPGGTALTPTESFAYDRVGNLVSRTDRRGFTTDFTFDRLNRVVRELAPAVGGVRPDTRIEYDDAGNRVATTDPTGARTTFAHDDLGRLRTQTQIVRQAPGGNFTSTFDYDDLGNQIYAQDPTGVVATSLYNVASELVAQVDARGKTTTFTYDAAGRQASATDPLGRAQVSVYDMAGRVTSVEAHAGSPTGALLARDFTSYDAVGNVVAQRSARSSSATDNKYVRSFVYDDANRLISTSEPNSNLTSGSFTTNYAYDAAGNLTRVTDGRGSSASVIYTYNAWGLRTSTIEPSTAGQTAAADRTFTTVYDAAGLPDKELQPGATIDLSFDELGRVTQEQGTGAGLTTATRTFGYDLAGRRTSVNHPNGAITFGYDDRGLLLSASVPGTSTAQSSFGYDGAGRMTVRTDAAGATTFAYDDRGDLWKATDPLTARTTEFKRDDSRAVYEIKYGTTSVRQIGYDTRGRIATDVLKTGTTVRSSYTYSYDVEGNVTGQNVVQPGNPSAGNHTYKPDRAGRLAEWKKPGAPVVKYTYDAAGNRITEGTASFVYDTRNRIKTGPDGTYTWSARGTMTQGRDAVGMALVYSFDALGRQTAAGAATYTYDGLDRMATRSGSAALYAGMEIDPVLYGAEKYVRSPAGELVAAQKNGASTFVGENRHGDITWYLDTAGATAGSAFYDPWGEPTTSGSSTSLGYQGDVTDPTTGDVWMGARWYDPGTAGFTSRDTVFGQLQTPVSLNRYTYAGNDPMQNFDPDGRMFCAGDRHTCKSTGRSPSGTTVRDREKVRDGKLTHSISSIEQEAIESTELRADAGDDASMRVLTSRIVQVDGKPVYNEDGTVKRIFWYKTVDDVDALRAELERGWAACSPDSFPSGKDAHLCSTIADALIELDNSMPGPSLWGAALTIANFLPFFGDLVDAWTCGYSGGSRDWGDAAINCGAMLPFLGLLGDAKQQVRIAESLEAADDANDARRVVSAAIGENLSAVGRALCSFDGETRVVMADGTTRRISDVRPGDYVLAKDPETGEAGPREVLATIPHTDELLTLDTSAGAIVTTEDHRYWNATDHEWQESQDLDVGDLLLSVDGDTFAVRKLDWSTVHTATAYDLTVAGLHTFYVAVGDEQALVHNCDAVNVLDETLAGSGNITSAYRLTHDEAMDAGFAFVGPGMRESMGRTGKGGDVFSATQPDGTTHLFRIEDDSLNGAHRPGFSHVHFQVKDVNGNEIVNNHVEIVP